MAKLSWNAPEERFFETGLDRGVFYPKDPPTSVLVGKNLVPNPTAANDVAGYASSAAIDVSRDVVWRLNGSFKLTKLAGGTNDSNTPIFGDTGAIRLGMEVGKTYTISADINTPVALTGTLNGNARRIVYYYKIGAGSYIQTSSPAGPTTGSSRVSLTFTVPIGATEAFIRLYNGSGVTGEYVLWDNILLIEGTSTEYFDGDSYKELYSAYSAEWLGTPNNSPSEKYQVYDTAFPWNGLSEVEEVGADSSVAYYIDGQKFLNFPKPKEFQANLKAYTYPDAFAKIMGLSEIDEADGLFVDGQTSEQFDLCYRTLVGNGVDGLGHGYKIHLIYNATVAAPSSSYESLSNEINPSFLSWEINAVPVEIEGYRPTAHFTIDTRHMSDDILAKIEKILYGDATTAPSMPDPVDLVELLTYGGAIIIVDNGDGTWTAKGSRHNIYLLDVDTFRIEGVETTDYGDGTFGVTTTPAP